MTGRILRFLLSLAPEPFRNRYGRELLEVHRARAREIPLGLRRLAFSIREILGLAGVLLKTWLGRSSTAATGRPSGQRSPRGGGFLRQDLRFALRTLRRRPGFSVTVVVILALGIGSATAIFSAANAYFFRPLPFQDARRLVRIYEINPEFGWTDADAAPANALDWREQVQGFQDLAMYTGFSNQATLIRDGEPTLLNMTSVSGNFFQVLGVPAALGRTFRWEETWEGEDRIVILSHAAWQTYFGADPGVVGRSVDFVGGGARVVGVMPPGFAFPSSDIQIWTPMDWNPTDRSATWFRRAHWVYPVARLAPGVTVDEARAQLQVVVRRLQQQYPETNRVMGAGLMPLRSFLTREIRGPLRILMGSVALLLVLACINVANLQLIRASDRSREVSIRFALGARRGRVARQILTESLLLSVLGGGLGLWLGWMAVGLAQELSPMGIQGATGPALDHRVILFSLVAAVLSGTLSAIAPVLKSTSGSVGGGLKDEGRGRTGSRRGIRTRNALVAGEVALALILVMGAGLMIRSFLHLREVDPGFSTQGTLAVQFTLPSARYGSRDQVLAFYDRFIQGLEGRPEIQKAGIVGQLPLNGASWSSQFQAEDWPQERVGLEILHRRADRGYFEALGIPLIRGRFFEATDGPDDPLVVLVNEAFVREHFPDRDPIGVRIAYDRNATPESAWYEIVGIVGDQNQVHPGQAARAEVFENRNQDWGRSNWVVIRTGGEAAAAIPAVRNVLQEMDPLLALSDVRTLKDVWRGSMAREEFLLALMGLFGAVAFLLASVGVYGVTAEATRTRTREIGIRMALGARGGKVVGLMVRRGMAVVLVGLLAGLVGGLMGARALTDLLFQVGTGDPLTVGLALGTLAVSALLASWLPARKASRVDPMDTLTAE